MISTVLVKVGKKSHKLKVSIQAQVRLERELGKQIGDVLEELFRGNGGVTLVVAFWAACLNDGAGVDEATAMDVLTDLGGANAGSPFLTEALQSAFPFLKPGEGDDAVTEEDGAEEAGNGAAA